jgi:hypothetical protein
MTHQKMTDIWREVNLNMSLSNDMMSLRKEIIHGDLDSIVPVLVYNRGFTVEEAIAVGSLLYGFIPSQASRIYYPSQLSRASILSTYEQH